MGDVLAEKRRLERGVYRVEGPSRYRVVEGAFYALGRIYGTGDVLTLPRGIVVCLKVEDRCVIEGFGNLSEAKPEEEVIDAWRVLAEDLAVPAKVVIVGEVDSGKTSFSTYLLNAALLKGLRVALIDADVGQNDVGWPGTIALALPEHPISWLGELDPYAFYFVGTNTPHGVEEAVILGVSKLLRKASDRDFIVVNTDGWVSDRRALAYKCRLIEAVEPNTLVVMSGTGASETLAKIFERTSVRVVRVPTPPAARGKERSLRKMRRELSYLDLLGKATVKTISLHKLKIWASYTFNCKTDENLSLALSTLLGFNVVAELCDNIVVLITINDQDYKKLIEMRDQLSKIINKDIMISCLSKLKGYLIGLMNDKFEHIAVGIMEEIDLKNGNIKVKTPFNVDGASILIIGRLRLSEEGIEVERGPPPLA